jgi:hypothetical protein
VVVHIERSGRGGSPTLTRPDGTPENRFARYAVWGCTIEGWSDDAYAKYNGVQDVSFVIDGARYHVLSFPTDSNLSQFRGYDLGPLAVQ